MDNILDGYIELDRELQTFGKLYNSDAFEDVLNIIDQNIQKIGDTLYPNAVEMVEGYKCFYKVTFGKLFVDRFYQELRRADLIDFELVDMYASREEFYDEAEKWYSQWKKGN